MPDIQQEAEAATKPQGLESESPSALIWPRNLFVREGKRGKMGDLVVFSRSDVPSLLCVRHGVQSPKEDAKRLSEGHAFSVDVVVVLSAMPWDRLELAMSKHEHLGNHWFKLTIAELFALLASLYSERAEEGLEAATLSADAYDMEEEAAEGEESALDPWVYLRPASAAEAPRATEVKAQLRLAYPQVAESILQLCREVSQKGTDAKYRKILKLGDQAVAVLTA